MNSFRMKINKRKPFTFNKRGRGNGIRKYNGPLEFKFPGNRNANRGVVVNDMIVAVSYIHSPASTLYQTRGIHRDWLTFRGVFFAFCIGIKEKKKHNERHTNQVQIMH